MTCLFSCMCMCVRKHTCVCVCVRVCVNTCASRCVCVVLADLTSLSTCVTLIRWEVVAVTTGQVTVGAVTVGLCGWLIRRGWMSGLRFRDEAAGCGQQGKQWWWRGAAGGWGESVWHRRTSPNSATWVRQLLPAHTHTHTHTHTLKTYFLYGHCFICTPAG